MVLLVKRPADKQILDKYSSGQKVGFANFSSVFQVYICNQISRYSNIVLLSSYYSQLIDLSSEWIMGVIFVFVKKKCFKLSGTVLFSDQIEFVFINFVV